MVISVTNLKGGVGKSTISRNLAAYFASKEIKVCIIDTDVQQRTTCDWLERRSEISPDAPYISVFPMVSVQTLPKEVKTHLSNGYQIVIIDGVPQLDVVATKTILISDLLVIPVTPSIDDLKSFQRFLERYEDVKVHRDNIPAYLVLNKFLGRNNEDKEIHEALSMFSEFGIEQMKSSIATRVSHARSSKSGLTAFEWPDDTKGKEEITRFCEEIEGIIEKLLIESE